MNIISASAAASLVAPGKPIYFAGCTAEPVAIINAIRQDPELWNNVQLFGTFIPGVNRFNYVELGTSTTVNCLFPTAAMRLAGNSTKNSAKNSARNSVNHSNDRVGDRAGSNTGSMLIHPLSYYEWSRFLGRESGIELAYCQVSPPNQHGQVSLGYTADFIPSLLSTSCRLVGVINPHIPFVPGSPSIALDRFEAFVESDEPLPEFTLGEGDATIGRIAEQVRSLLRDGDILQLGLGKLQQALLPLLAEMKQIGLQGGMVSDPVLELFELGVLTKGVTTGVALGTERFYNEAASTRFSNFKFKPVSATHHPAVLRELDNFVAINSVLEVDLQGQINAAYVGGQQVTAPGGMIDFARGATSSVGGRSIMALPSTTRDGLVSRIVKRLPTSQPVSISPSNVQFIVTEYGIADLRNKTDASSANDANEIAGKIAAIAHPKFRESLALA